MGSPLCVVSSGASTCAAEIRQGADVAASVTIAPRVPAVV